MRFKVKKQVEIDYPNVIEQIKSMVKVTEIVEIDEDTNMYHAKSAYYDKTHDGEYTVKIRMLPADAILPSELQYQPQVTVAFEEVHDEED